MNSRGITKRDALELVDGMGAIQALDHLSTMMSCSETIHQPGLKAAYDRIDGELRQWGENTRREIAWNEGKRI